MKPDLRLWLVRLPIFIVTAWNLQAALTFIFNPAAYTAGFELSGVPGEVALRGMGVLFLMWNVPYLVALWHPLRYRLALALAFVMQGIGVIGERIILGGLPPGYPVLRSSLDRFIAFDIAGWMFLLAALVVIELWSRPRHRS